MRNYVIKRLMLIPVTILGILLVNFLIIQVAPGGPVEHMLAKYQGVNVDAKSNFSSTAQMNMNSGMESKYKGASGVPPEMIAELEKQFGFDKPAHERFFKMIREYVVFDFGKSFYKDKTVGQLIVDRLK